MPSQRITGAQAVIRCLEEEGVQYVFGYPGGAVLPIYDAVYHSRRLRHVLVRHEQCAAHMAEGFARATGKPGVCMATSGPGATNLVTGIANANMDSTPLVAITGNVFQTLIGSDAFQEADITGITMPITKHNWLVTDARDLPRVMKEAFHVATTGRPGPVLVDIPKDVQMAELDFEYPTEVHLAGYHPVAHGPREHLRNAAELIRLAKRPVLYVGGGVHASGAYHEVFEFVETVGAPVVTTLHGKGTFPETHRQSLRMFGMHGSRYANYTVQRSDLVIAIGARFDDRVTGKLSAFAPDAKVIHLDIDPAEHGKNVFAHVPIVGDVKTALPELLAEVRREFDARGRNDIAEWWKQVEQWRERYPLRYKQDPAEPILPQHVIAELYRKTRGQAIVTSGVGEHQMFAAQHYLTTRPRQWITSGGLGTMGFGLPAAIGAQVAQPDQLVIDIDGDGSFQMTLQELATAVKLKLPIKIFILNNMYLGMVRQWQELFYDNRYSEVLLGDCPDFVKLAEAYGCLGLRAQTVAELDGVLDRALAHSEGPVLVDVRCKPEECCYPMVAPGKGLDDMIGGE